MCTVRSTIESRDILSRKLAGIGRKAVVMHPQAETGEESDNRHQLAFRLLPPWSFVQECRSLYTDLVASGRAVTGPGRAKSVGHPVWGDADSARPRTGSHTLVHE